MEIEQDVKTLFIDTETTGLLAWKHDIIQLAYIVDINGEVKDEGHLFIQPCDFTTVQERALKVSGTTLQQLADYTPSGEAYETFVEALSVHVDRFNKNDKFSPAGYNISFDVDFLSQFFKKNGDKYYGSFFSWTKIDPMYILYYLNFMGVIKLPDFKLATACTYFGIETDAHNALSDIRATRELTYILKDQLKWTK